MDLEKHILLQRNELTKRYNMIIALQKQILELKIQLAKQKIICIEYEQYNDQT